MVPPLYLYKNGAPEGRSSGFVLLEPTGRTVAHWASTRKCALAPRTREVHL